MPKGKHSIKKVKFTNAEMAYEPPAEVDFSSGLVFRGLEGWRVYREWRRKVAILDPEIRKAFPDDRSVNQALRKMIEAGRHDRSGGRRKSA